MKLLFDARVLTHKNFTGVENYTQNILENLSGKLQINIAKPNTTNKYIAHLWSHFILPFKKGNILFCPANTAPIFVPKNKKLIITIHDVAFLTYPNSFSKLFYWYYKYLVPRNIKRANTIITVSHSSKKEILKYYPEAKNKIKVVYLGINRMYRKFENLKKTKSILYVGSLNERKNFNSVIESFELLDNSNLKLIIVGNFSSIFSIHNESNTIIERAKVNTNILFKENVQNDELVKLYNEANILIFPSFYEGFGLPPLEAMACGTSVITSNISSMPEVCGDAAVYINPYSINDISSKMKILLTNENLREEMIIKGFKRVEELTWYNAGKKHISLFEEIMERERK